MTTTPPVFIENDPDAILADLVSIYQQLSGKVLQPAQIERLLLNAYAYRESLLRSQIQNAALQNLVAFASAPALDYLGELVGVVRLPSAPAVCTLEFTLVSGHTGVIIPENTRVASKDGKVFFATVETVSVPVGTDTVSVEAFASPVGVIGNGYALGEITEILDPVPWLLTAANTDATVGGADTETDDQLRERIRLAPAAFSTAGSRGAYQYWAKTASVLIVDVAVIQPTPGTVKILPLMADGTETPTPILNLVASACNDETVRPLTDTVLVESPTISAYDIELEIVIFNGLDADTVLAEVTAQVEAYKANRARRLGQDITIDQIKAAALLADKVYSVDVIQPAADLILGETEVGICGTVTITITDTTDG